MADHKDKKKDDTSRSKAHFDRKDNQKGKDSKDSNSSETKKSSDQRKSK